MPLQQAPTLEREHRMEIEDPNEKNPFLAFIVVLAGIVALIALIAALSGDGAASDVNFDRPVPADAR